LFAPPSFAQGVATASDLYGLTFGWNDSNSTAQADFLALRADWLAVAADIRASIKEIIGSTAER
jgi:hypothetical protein